MTNAQIIHSYQDALYAVKRGFLIIGLTGYTGSGCSTVRNLLVSPDKIVTPAYDYLSEFYDDPKKPSFENELEHRKLTRVWDKLNWDRFVPIEFSCVVFAFAMREALSGTNFGQENPLAELYRLGISHYEKLMGLKLLTDEKKNDGNAERLSDENLKIPKNAQLLTDAYKCALELYEKFRIPKTQPELTNIMQPWGDQIRQYGDIQLTDNNENSVHPESIAILPEAVRRIMKSYQTLGYKKFCIDAFRNPYEVEYFRRRYSEFYLVHLNRSREHRQSALSHFSDEEFNRLEKREQGKLISNKGEILKKTAGTIHKWFPSQNVDECAQKADFFINNVQDKQQYLFYHLIRLLVLAHQPGCVPPTEDERSMQIAMTARQMSGCISRQVGAVVVASSGFVVGVGWNDPPKGQVPCSLRTGVDLVHSPTSKLFSDYERSSKFTNHMNTHNCEP